MSARVYLGERSVGYLEPVGERVSFRFDYSYVADPRRPVLSQSFEELSITPERVFQGESSKEPLPSFFANLLPEGALRKLLESRLSRPEHPEYAMLVYLGADLPGNVRVEPDDSGLFDDRDEASPMPRPRPGDPLRFALAGEQLKASVLGERDRVTLPLSGEDGDWIAKFPSSTRRELPENEHGMLRWAKAAGLDVPDHRLVAVSSIHNLPEGFPTEGDALIVRRFDRGPGGARIHQEDFAQVFGISPHDKYLSQAPDYVSYAGIGAVVRALAGVKDFLEYLKRVVFMILCGNGDAHAKNWALIYPDGLRPRLSPLYDFVATVAYPTLGGTLALGLHEPEDPDHTPPQPILSVGDELFGVMARHANVPSEWVEAEVRAFVQRARSTWPDVRAMLPPFTRAAVERHLAACRLG